VGAEGLRAEHEGEGLNITTVGWGRMGDWRPLPQVAPELGDCAGPEDASGDCERRVHLERPGLIEWWASRGEGMQQGWELEQRPAGDGPVVIELEVQGAEVEAEGDGGALWLTDEAGTLWRYAGLDAWDAHGQPLDAWMETDGARVWVAVDDEGAAWPISVDPVLTTASRTWTGTVPTDYFGFALAGAGDINNDGYDDVAVGSPGYSLTTGRVYIYFGSATGPGTTANVTLASPALASTFGAAVDFVGDVNNDGIDDIAVGAPLYTGSASQMGAVYVWHGSASFSGGTYTTQLTGSSSANAYFGSALSRGGDLDGDGYDDIIVGEYGYNSNRGRAWAFAGGASGAGADSVRLTGSTSANDHGFSVSGGGSINGDGYADVLVGAPRDSSSSANGRAYAYYGEAGFFGSATQSSDRSWTGFPAGELAGAAVQVRADVNGDGRDDALVGAPGAAKVYVYNGSASGFSSSATATLSGTAGTYFGNAIGNLGDTSGDGIDDVVIGAYTTSSSAGVAYVYDGSATGLSTASQTFTGSAAEQLGFSAVGAGDVNNDGYGDLLIGAPGWTSFTGEVFLYYGAVDADGDGYYAGTTAGTDCDDSDAAVNPATPAAWTRTATA
jgi:hypothetical protein